MKKYILLFLAWLGSFAVFGQQYTQYAYTTEDGLPSNLTKSVFIDQHQMVWVATDDGLVVFDGKEFTRLRTELPNRYLKKIIFDSVKNEYLVIGDIEAGIVTPSAYQYAYRKLISGGTGLTDTSIAYPKNVYLDKNRNIWIAEISTIVRLTGQKMKRYKLPPHFGSDSFISSFYFFESESGNFYVLSWSGYLAMYDAKNDSFIDISKNELFPLHVHGFSKYKPNSILVGTRTGLYELSVGLKSPSDYQIKQISTLKNISAVFTGLADKILLGTHDNGIFIAEKLNIEGTQRKISSGNLQTINQIYADNAQNIWATTDNGLINLQAEMFVKVPWETKVSYILTTIPLGDNHFFAANNESVIIVSLTSNGIQTEKIIDFKKNVIYGLTVLDKKILISFRDATFSVYDLTGKKIKSLENIGGRFRFFVETEWQTVWAVNETDHRIISIDRNLKYEYLTDENHVPNHVQSLGVSSNKKVLLYTSNNSDLLYKWDNLRSQFIPMFNQPLNLKPNTSVRDVIEDKNGNIFLGTTSGLYVLKNNSQTAELIENEFKNLSVKSIVSDSLGRIYAGTENGIYIIDQNEIIKYDRYSGLTSATITDRSMSLLPDGRLVAGTPNGISFSQHPFDTFVRSSPPKILHVLINNKDDYSDSVSVYAGSAVEFKFTSFSNRTSGVIYEYRMLGLSDEWRRLTDQNIVSVSNLPIGNYRFEVRSKVYGQTWSDLTTFTMSIISPWYSSYPAIFFYIVFGVSVFVLLGTNLTRSRFDKLKRESQHLEEQVKQRTKNLLDEKEKTENALKLVQQHEEKLMELDQIKSRFFSNISHEFRTPLTLALGPVESILENAFGPVKQPVKEQLRLVQQNISRLLRLINQLLDISKIESGNMTVFYERIDGNQFLNEVISAFMPVAKAKNISIRLSLQGSSCLLSIDPDKFEKIIANLLSNALKFTPKGGTVEVSLTIRNVDDREFAELIISDTGVGIPEEKLPKIFDRFFQVGKASNQVQEGTGIGLSLVKDLVELHDGQIRVESEVGKGTTFTLLWPRFHADAEKGTEFIPFEMSNKQSVEIESNLILTTAHDTDVLGGVEKTSGLPSVLIVDDNADIRKYIALILKNRYLTLEAIDGEDALNKVRKYNPDIILSDVAMPTMDGIEFCRLLRADSVHNSIPLIFLTAKTGEESLIEGLEAGADDYLSKPFNAKELIARLNNVLKLHTQEKELKKLLGELQTAYNEVRAANELKTELLGVASHDLKNPLQAIIGYVEIIQSTQVNQTVSDRLSKIRQSAERMVKLVNNLLDTSALESGKLNLLFKPVTLADLLKQVIENNVTQARIKSQIIELKFNGNTKILVEGDEERLRDAFDNLINNAVKYSGSGKKIEVNAVESHYHVRVEIKDEGPGLTEDDKKKLFGKFQRLSAKPTAGESSTGLGLSIVKDIIELHNGKIWAESKLGRGTSFFVEIPVLRITEL